MKKTIILLIIAAISLTVLASCGKKNEEIVISSAGYLAQGTIPVDAKIHPIIDDDMAMNVIKNGADVSEEDIAEIVSIVDKFETIARTNEENPDDSFLLDIAVEDIRGGDIINKFFGSQIIDITFNNADDAYALVMTRLDGTTTNNPPDGSTLEGDTLVLWEAGLRKMNDKWYIYFAGDHFVGPYSEYYIARDTVNGKINVGKYDTAQ